MLSRLYKFIRILEINILDELNRNEVAQMLVGTWGCLSLIVLIVVTIYGLGAVPFWINLATIYPAGAIISLFILWVLLGWLLSAWRRSNV